MKENEIKILSKGIRMKTLAENIDIWTERILNVFKENGYEFICSEEIEDCVQLTLERDVDALILTINQNGEMQFNTTESISELLNIMVPQIEENLGVTFKQSDDNKQNINIKSKESRDEILKRIENDEEPLDTSLIHNTSKISNVINNLEQHFAQKKCCLTTSDYFGSGSADRQVKNTDIERMGIMQKKRLLLFLSAQHDELIYMKRRLNKSQDELTMLRTDMTTLKDQFYRFKIELSRATWKTDEKVETVLKGLQSTKEKFYESIRNEISVQMMKIDHIE